MNLYLDDNSTKTSLLNLLRRVGNRTLDPHALKASTGLGPRIRR
jgi:hypothetical protein